MSRKAVSLFREGVVLLIVSILMSACGTIIPTSTPTPLPTDTPLPTSTVTPTATSTETPTPVPSPTRTATPNRTATKAAVLTATQSAQDQIVASELAKIGVDASQGKVVWMMNDAYELDGSGFATGWYQPVKELGVLKDFVVQSEITWDTSGALAGCAIMFRAPKDFDLQNSSFYELFLMRVAYAPEWMINYYEDGHWQYSLPTNNGGQSKNILDAKLSTNVVTMDVKGDTFTVYINGVKERSVQNNKVAEGRLAFEVVQNSGSSYCKFDKSWVWAYSK